MVYSLLIAVIVLICVLLTIVVLLQPGQGQGLSGGIAGGMAGGSGLGARRAADLLSKSTTVLAAALLVLCILANFFIDRGEANRSAIQESGVEAPVESDFDNPSQTPSAIPELPQNQDNSDSDN